MIDPHVHLRDWNQAHKETVEHGLKVAYEAGLDAVFEMPNTSPVLTNRKAIEDRIKLGDEAKEKLGIPIFHGIYAGITDDPEQIKEVVELYKELFPRIVGLKMFSGHSTGNMGLVSESQQKIVYKTLAELDYKGVLVNHCEKENLMQINLWDPNKPITHTIARPPEAEVQSVRDQINLATREGFKGTLHIAHLSVPEAFEVIEKARRTVDFKITCEVTPHHALLYDSLMDNENGLFLKMNPPLRSKEMQEKILDLLLTGKINYIGTDHAPHTLAEKNAKNPASGIPGLPFYPKFIKMLSEKGVSQAQINNLTHNNILSIFGIHANIIPNTNRFNTDSEDLSKEYEFDAFSNY